MGRIPSGKARDKGEEQTPPELRVRAEHVDGELRERVPGGRVKPHRPHLVTQPGQEPPGPKVKPPRHLGDVLR